jgi:hypothetical protein
MLTGSAKKLDDLVEDDIFKASVTVLGSIDYDTQIAGNTSVLLLDVSSIKVIDSPALPAGTKRFSVPGQLPLPRSPARACSRESVLITRKCWVVIRPRTFGSVRPSVRRGRGSSWMFHAGDEISDRARFGFGTITVWLPRWRTPLLVSPRI